MIHLPQIIEILKNSKEFIFNSIQPYKHVTISSVNEDADIENQLERVVKSIVVCTGNIFVNFSILKIDAMKKLISFMMEKIKKMQTNEPCVQVHEKDD